MLLADPAADVLALRARANLAANAAALGRSIALPALTWRLARDGMLTAHDGSWLAGCSVPRRAAEVMLRKTIVDGNVACLVLPNHAGQVLACQGKLSPSQALIALLNGEDDLPSMLACHDFSADIAAGRLMFAWDESSLHALFKNNPGMPVPQQYVRIATSPAELAEPAMKMAQRVFGLVMPAQHERIRAAAKQSQPTDADLCIVVSRRFRLWDDAGDVLAGVSGGEVVDCDIPTRSATAHVAERIAAGRAVVMANMGRADRSELAAINRPWICWVTGPRVPAFVASQPRDGLLLADETFAPLATAAGWPASRVRIAAYPIEPLPPPGKTPTLIADLPSLKPPEVVCDFSSWRVAWEHIDAELQADPLRIGNDASAYLDRVLRQYEIDEPKLPRALFLNGVVAGAFAVGVAKLLKARGASPAVYGSGWQAFADTIDWRGPIADRAALRSVVSGASYVIDPYLQPLTALRAIDRPIVRAFGLTLPSLIGQLRSPQRAARPSGAILSQKLILELLDG